MRTAGITRKRITTSALTAFAAAVACLLLSPASSSAGSYQVWTAGGIYGGPASCPDVQGPFGSATFIAENRCHQPSGDFGISTGPGEHGPGYRVWELFAPPGTVFASGHVDAHVNSANGDEARINIGNGTVHTGTITAGTGGTWQGIDWYGHGNTTQFSVFVNCVLWCGNATSSSWSFARNLIFTLTDSAAPGVSLAGPLTGGGWRNSGGAVSVAGSDAGGGIEVLDVLVNGSRVVRDSQSCATTSLFGGTMGTRLTPCPTSPSISRTLAASQFNQGSNSLQACAHDFSGSGDRNAACTTTTVLMDTVAPGAPNDFAVAGGEDWRAENDFDVSWSNAGQAHAPIDGAMYRISRNGGGYDSGAQFVSGNNRNSLENLQVPSPGEYTLRVWTRDAAGNHSEADARTATLRFDPTVPPESEAEFNGWIRRNDFAYQATWDRVDPGALGPSGLDGYAVRVTRDPDSDPCVTEGHESPTCSAAEINNDGVDDTSMPVQSQDVSEGEWYIHVAPVTGAGVKAAVHHTAMPVDVTDPDSTISGADGEWTNREVTVSVSASDELSGMAPNPSYSVDPQPRTCIQVGGHAADCEPDDTITRVISTEGEHQLSAFARDLAGNENDGQPDAQVPTLVNNPANQATARIDKSGPHLAFSTRTVDDPARLVVKATDELSGLAEGSIQLRRQGSTADWLAIETSVAADGLHGRVPDDLDPGRYEFRASATDRAGNASSTSNRADGTPMVEELPLKEAVRLTAQIKGAKTGPQKGKGKCKKAAGRGKKCKGKRGRAALQVKVPYGRSFELFGHLQTSSDAPLRDRELEVTERMADGSAVPERVRTVTTDQGGAYSLSLPAGPSRSITVRFPGDTRYRPTVTEPVDVAVPSKVLAFKAPKAVREKRTIRFSGRVGMDGVDLGSRGKRVELQYEKVNGRGKGTGKWATIASDEANGARGRFKVGYPLRSNYRVRTRVRFRAILPPERGWPYDGVGRSRGRSTVILP